MKWKKDVTYAVIIAALVAIILILQQCGRPPLPPQQQIITIHDTIPGDSIPYLVEIPKPYPVVIDSTDTLWMERPIDTSAILKDYFKKKYYSIIAKDDTSAFIQIRARVYKNELDSIDMFFQNKRPTLINNTTIINGEKPRVKMYAGLDIGLNMFDKEPIIGASLLLTTKRSFAYAISWDTPNTIHGTLYYKISFKNR